MLKFGAVFSPSCRIVDAVADFASWTQAASRRSWPRSGWREEARDLLAWRPPGGRRSRRTRKGRCIRWKSAEPCRSCSMRRIRCSSPTAASSANGRRQRLRLGTGSSTARQGRSAPRFPFAAAAQLARPASHGHCDARRRNVRIPCRRGWIPRRVIRFLYRGGWQRRVLERRRQIQLRAYGAARARGCELLPARYDRVAEGFGAHGEHVTRASELAPALERAARRRPRNLCQCRHRGIAAPVYRRAPAP